MAAAAPVALAPSPKDAVLDHDSSNISSPLSDVEDKDGDSDDNMMQTGQDAGQGDQSDSDSNLSDVNDTEAETERLYDTPRNQRHKDVVVGKFSDGHVYERTPSRLQRSELAADEARHDDSMSEDVSEPPSPPDEETPTKPSKPSEKGSSADESKTSSQERKRKRSPTEDQSESEQPSRKRTGSVGTTEPDNHDGDDEVAMVGDDGMSAQPRSGEQSGLDESTELPESRDETAAPDEPASRETRGSKKNTRHGGKRGEDANGEEAAEGRDEDPDAESRPRRDEEAMDADAEDEPDAHGKSVEEGIAKPAPGEAEAVFADRWAAERKQAAFDDYTHLDEMFGIFRDRLYKERLDLLEQEEQSLTADVPYHPGYLNMKQAVDERYQKRVGNINREHELHMEAHERLGRAKRAQIWGQYHQAVREKREKLLEKLNQEWYDIQAARRSGHGLADRTLLFPKDAAQRTRNAVAYNTEVSTLASIAKYEGFPAVPPMRGASSAELEEDFEVFDRVKQRHRPAPQPRDEIQASSFGGLGPAGEQFIKNTPWANPNHQAHRLHYQAAPQADSQTPKPASNGQSSEQPLSPQAMNQAVAAQLARLPSNPGHSPAARASSFDGKGLKTGAVDHAVGPAPVPQAGA